MKKKKKIHYAWMICIAGILMLFCSIGLVSNVFSVYQPFIIKLNNFSYTQGSMLVTLRMVSALLSLLFVDKYYNVLDIKKGAALAIASIGIAYFIFAIADQYWVYAIAALVSGIGYSLGAMIPVSIIVGRWFKSHKALALGICSAGTGVATVIMPSVITVLIENVGLHKTFLLEAVLIMLIAGAVFVLLKNYPEDIGVEPLVDVKKIEKQNTKLTTGYTLSEKEWIIMLAILFLLGGGGSNGFTHLGVLYTTENYSSMEVAQIISAAGVLLGIGKCIYGDINDRIGAYKANYLFVTLLIAGLLCCCLAPLHSKVVLVTCVLTMGFGFPVNNVGVPIWAGDLSKPETYGKVLKSFQIAYSCGTMVFSFIIGVSADIFGSYVPIYMFFTFLSVLFLVTLQKIYRAAGYEDTGMKKGRR